MWLFTRYGFYSIACAQKSNGEMDVETMMIRARSMDHLQNLKARFPALAEAEILALPDRDYRWRVVVAKNACAAIVAEMVEEQEWSNFKNEVARHHGSGESDYSQALHQVWQVMYGFQQKQTAKSAKKRSH
jgi:hypothetical protein